MPFFVINKQLDYDRGYMEGLEYRDGRLQPEPGTRDRGFFISRVFDSREEGTIWHRFTIDGGETGGAGMRVSVYTFETEELTAFGHRTTVGRLARSPQLGLEEKQEALSPFLKKQAWGCCDLLLHEAEGRYLLLILELFPRETPVSAGDMYLYFPKDTWMKYLPGVYSRSREAADFTERFLSIFQSFYDDRDREIRSGAALIDPVSAGRSLLEELAGWYDMKDLYLWPDERLRALVSLAPELTQKRGTAAGLREYLRLYLGEAPVIGEDPEDPYTFTVSVPPEYIDNPREYRSLLRVISHMKPAGMSVRVLPAGRRKQAGEEIRLGMNMRLEDSDNGRGNA